MSDLTFYPDNRIEESIESAGAPAGETAQLPRSHDFLSYFEDTQDELQRSIACRCYAGTRWSVTAREMKRDPKRMGQQPLSIASPDRSGYKPAQSLECWPADFSAAEPDTVKKQRKQNARDVKTIWDLANRGHAGPRHGVIVIAGATGSRKTTYAREISRLYIDGLLQRGGDRPHIVTYEDPIESWFAYSPEDASAAGFEYTPRQKSVDVDSLDAAITDALRQKPALLYVNEIRGDADWRSLLHFAGTGHLAITTTHAGSLVEAFERILDAASANTPDSRRRIASRIVAIVHLRLFGRTVIPSLWAQTSPALTAMTQDGLSSLLPGGEEGPCIGRRYFGEAFRLGEDVIRDALRSDLNGE